MNNYSQKNWPYPGSRWWKFDFHTHTPASRDTYWYKQEKDSKNGLTPEKWLLKFMEAEIDCVAVTDHNTGDWIDKLKFAYKKMLDQAEEGSPPEGFRELTLFPGVEISVNGGLHLLAIFDPENSTRTISDLLAKVGYKGTHGDCDGVTEDGPSDVIKKILDFGGIPVPAHSDKEKGLLQVRPGTRECANDAGTIKQVLSNKQILAVEWVDKSLPMPDHVNKEAMHLVKVLGSDCHSFRENNSPGLKYTWIKMASPTLEGLRLALLDGEDISVRRSDDGDFKPFQTPTHFITQIEIESARFMGNGKQVQLKFTPYFNALIGGRGTGKSTIVHALRLAYRDDIEFKRSFKNTEPLRQFESFSKPMSGREGDGGLRENTQFRIVLCSDDVKHRIIWRQDGKGDVVEEQKTTEGWHSSPSQAIKAERFPIRLFSQGQIASLAGESQQALLDVIDEAANASNLHQKFENEKLEYFSQRARLRRIDGQLEGRFELERKLDVLDRKLNLIAQSDTSKILMTHKDSVIRLSEINTSLEQLMETPERIKSMVEDLHISDWQDEVFDSEKNQDIISWRNQVDQMLSTTREALTNIADKLIENINCYTKDNRIQEFRQYVEQTKVDYEKLQYELAKKGFTDSREFGISVYEQQQLRDKLKELDELQQERNNLYSKNKKQLEKILISRKAITEARQNFLQNALEKNRFVRIEVVGFGYNHLNIERSLRDLLECNDGKFEKDILLIEHNEPISGLVFELAKSEGRNREKVLNCVKQKLVSIDEKFNGHFKNYLKTKYNKPEFKDNIDCWFPEDDLRINYSRDGDGKNWANIAQGSQGQRSAALLAFLLAFGDEPLVLDQPEDDLDNQLIYDLIVHQIRENKLRRQLIIVTHNPNIVVNGDAEMVHALAFSRGQCQVKERGALQEDSIRDEVCRVVEGGREAFSRRWARLGHEF